MPSGKQVSFAFGEVSPSLRFRASDISYANGLYRLRNGYVRKAGGVSNRPGFEMVKEHEFQDDIPTVGGVPGIKGFTHRNSLTGLVELLEYHRVSPTEYRFFRDGGAIGFGGLTTDVSPAQLRFIALKNDVFTTPSIAGLNQTIRTSGVGPSGLGSYLAPSLLSGTSGTEGRPPYLPVSYFITSVHDDGTEREIIVFHSGPIPDSDNPPVSGNAVTYPHAALVAKITLTFVSAISLEDVKYLNFYRGAGRTGVSYKLAGRVKTTPSSAVVEFADYGAEEPAYGPPEDASLLGSGTSGVSDVTCAVYYQQRLITTYDSAVATRFKPGDIGASKLGAPTQVIMPFLFNPVGPFQFTVPVSDGFPVVSFLAMERLLAMTEKGTYVIRGGEQGVLTPTAVNPLLISEEGGSSVVEPKVKGRLGAYANSDHSKIMGVLFGVDGNLTVADLTEKADHFLREFDIHAMEVVGGVEDAVYILRRDGKLIRATVANDAVGFSLIETAGFVENIFVSRTERPYVTHVPTTPGDRTEPPYDTLMAYVIRDGVRYLERLAYRDDVNREGEIFADNAALYGTRLTKKPDGSYRKIYYGDIIDVFPLEDVRANIEGGVTWAEGESVTVQLTDIIDLTGVLHFYTGEGAELQTYRFIPTGVGTPAGGDYVQAFDGYFNRDIPEELQDVESQALSAAEKKVIQTRWVHAFNKVTGLTRFYQKEVSVTGDGAVLSSPLDPSKGPALTADVTGQIDLPDYYAFGVVGLPYEMDMETLDLETDDSRTLTDAGKLINAAGIAFHETRGGYVGLPDKELSEMQEIPLIETVEWDKDSPNINGHRQIQIPSEWNRHGRIRIRQVDPLPITVLAVYPKGIAGD